MRLGPYELVRQIGAGGMGEVWVAHRVGAGAHEILAVKRLPERLAGDPTYRRILLAEARMAMLLRHPNIVHVFDAGEIDGEAYIAMEFVHGLDLSQLRKLLERRAERLPTVVIAYVIGEVLRGLDYAHNLDHEGELLTLVHRDVSPHNVMLSTTGEVKLTDFGVARLASEDTSGTHVKGKVRYMSPEQLRGESRSPTVDLFAAGAVLQELLDGTVFRGEAIDDARLLGMAVDGVVPPPQRPREIPPALERLRRRLLAPDSKTRSSNANEALELLHHWEGYRDAGPEVAKLVLRYLEHQAAIDGQPTQTGLEHQATFLHTNDAIRIESSGGFKIFDKGARPDEGLLSADLRQGPDDPTIRTAARFEERARTDGEGPASTAGPPRAAKAELVLDLPEPSVVRPLPTNPNPIVPPRSPAKLIVLALLVAGLGVGAWLGIRALLVDTDLGTDTQPASAESGLLKARVIGDDFAGYAGFRQRRMDKLTTSDILYSYVSGSEVDAQHPLAALAAGEAEFALTTLDQVLLDHAAREPGDPAPGKIVAIVDVSLGGDALVLDTKEHPSLRSVQDLAKLARKLGREPVLAYASETPSEYLDLYLDDLLRAVDRPGLRREGELGHVQAVYDVLAADASEDAPVVAALLWEPWVTRAREAGMTVAASTRDLPHALVDVLVASERTLAKHPELVDTVVATYYREMLAQQTEPGGLIEQIARDIGLTEAEATRTLASLCILDAGGAAPWFTSEGDEPPLLGAAIDRTWSTLHRAGRVDGEAPTLAKLADPRAVIAAAADQPGGSGNLAACLDANETPGASTQALGELELPASEESWFLAGDATLTVGRADAVAELATRLRAFNVATIAVEITGYGDDRSRKARALGQARAEAIATSLRQADVALAITTRGANGRRAPTTKVRVSLTRAR